MISNGILDAVECSPTYSVSQDTVQGIIAGGYDCMFRDSENAEDGAEAGVRDPRERNPKPEDTVVGISAAGNPAYVAEALDPHGNSVAGMQALAQLSQSLDLSIY